MKIIDAVKTTVIVVLGAASMTLSPIGSTADLDVRVIPLKHRLADEITPTLRPLLAPGESINSIDSRLIVRASPRSLALIQRTLEQIDTPRHNLRISVRQGGRWESEQQRLGVSGEIRNGTTRIIAGGSKSNDGFVFRRSTSGGSIEVQTERRVTTARETATQSLTVADGGHAFLRVGESIPQVQPFLALAGNRLTLAAGVQYTDVTTGFDVEPHLIGDQVQLTASPRLTFGANGGERTVNFQELRTVLTVTPGEWVDLGSSLESGNEVSREILVGAQQGQSRDNARFLIRVDSL
jgi:type II secretory pathway component GspD/PulD (secretin)